MEGLGTEVRSFYSLQDLQETLEEEIDHYKTIVEEYNQWLGLFLRDSESAFGDQEWFKNLAALQKSLKAGKKTAGKNKKPGKKEKQQSSSPDWIPYKEIMLCANEQGQAEIVFEAIEEINDKIDRLGKIGNTISELMKSGLGIGITYVTFIREGVPEKLVLRRRKDKELADRFKFVTEISVPAAQTP